MRIDVATAHDGKTKSIIARVNEDATTADLAAVVAHMGDDDEVAYRVVEDGARLREGADPNPKDGEDRNEGKNIGEWTFLTAGALEKLKPSAIVAGEAKAAKKGKGKR